ncbi:hypothetical protein J1614_011456 [Plenodomus biglobosus]|nr:hypothetical protein J1614_011456 [Plenodomus biglobosus]
MNEEIIPPPHYAPWGPFIPERYQLLRITQLDIALASTAFALAGVFAISAAYIAVEQTKRSPRPWKSIYLWMVWLEWSASVVIAIECLLFLLRIIRPSFYFYMSILFCWTIQIQLLLQIIINRIRIILTNRRHGLQLMWGTALIISLLCISVYIIWIPASLQISQRWVHINTYWDRTEKVIYLFVDAALNVYFIRVVKENLVRNGLQKYDRLVRFNQRMIGVSILMDVMIIAAMDIPNGFVYAIFHPLAYLIKLNIELSMAHLITRIALSNQTNPHPPPAPTFDGGHSANSSVTANSDSSPQPPFLHRFFRRPLNPQAPPPQTLHNDAVINQKREFTLQSCLAIDPENVQMEAIQEERSASSVSSPRPSNDGYQAGLRSIEQARSNCRDEASVYSGVEEELLELESGGLDAGPPSHTTEWSQIRLDGLG